MNKPTVRPPRSRTARVTSSLGSILVLTALPLHGQTSPRLEVGASIERTFEDEGTHTFLVELERSQVACGEVDQRSVDVTVTAYSPGGARIGRFDDTGRQWEPFCVETEEAGLYALELSSFNHHMGRYVVRLDRIEPVASTPAGRFDQWVDNLDHSDRPGGAVAAVRDGKVVYARAYGLADLAHGVPFTLNTAANIGSVSKQFTGLAVALLDSEGALSLDDDVRLYLPELPDLGQRVTLRHLLHHTSGIRDVTATLPLQGLEWADADRDGVLRQVQRQRELQHAPGAEYHYNNTGYVLLAEVVARVTDTPFGEWMRQRVFQPLGMDGAVVQTVPGQVVRGGAKAYVRFSERDVDVFSEPPTGHAWYGATGIYASVNDLLAWLRNFREPRVGGRDVMAELTERGVLNSGDVLDYGLGIGVTRDRGALAYSHGGGDGGFVTRLTYLPEIDAGFVVISAGGSLLSLPERAGEAFLEPLLPTTPAPAGGAKAEDAIAEIESEAVSQAALAHCGGRYGIDGTRMLLTLRAESGALRGELDNAVGFLPARLLFHPLSDSSFVEEGGGTRLTFRRDADGAVEEGAMEANGGTFHLRRLPPYAPSEWELDVYAGRYHSPELELIYTVTVQDGSLEVSHHRLGEIVLLPKEPDLFVASRWPLDEVRFERDDAGDVVGLVTRGISFERLGR